MAKVSKASKTSKAKATPTVKTSKPAKVIKAKPVKKALVKSTKKPASKSIAPIAKKEGSRRIINDAKIAKLQKMYASKKHSAQSLCDEFGISMATLFNYLKVKV